MRALISFYLLIKSAFRRKFTRLDIRLAQAIRPAFVPRDWPGGFIWLWCPTYIEMIAEMKQEAVLPEAFTDFLFGLKEDMWALIGLGED